jgi:cobalt-precorrin-5B (C1)-methyltransferase
MREETPEQKAPLRSGFTTGACATATSFAAGYLLLTGEALESAEITLPRGKRVRFALEFCRRDGEAAIAGVIKDAGDDPDVTHGALIHAKVMLSPTPGVRFHAGEGVGVATRPGTPVPVGEPAINPVPRQMMNAHMQRLASEFGHEGGFELTIGVRDGERLALKTMNPRLGILGGISILGTTGIVRPFSCSAYIASIHQGIDVARANGISHVAACTGSTSERTAQQHYQLPEMAIIEMGDFVGAVLKHLKHHPLPQVTLVGGFGKFSKLAAGHLDTHSRSSSIDLDFIAEQVKALGGHADLLEAIRGCNTSLEALAMTQQQGLPLGDRICELALARARRIVPESVAMEVWVTDKVGTVVGRAGAI